MINTTIKTSLDYTKETTDNQILNPFDLTMSEELFGCGVLKFSTPIGASLETLSELKKVSAYFIKDSQDVEFFTGFVSKISFDFYNAYYEVSCEKAWLKRKVLYTAKNYTDKTVDFILDEILGEVNARKFTGEADLINGNEITATISKEWAKGTDYKTILEDIASVVEGEWKVSKNQIILKPTIGEDKTTGVYFTEFVSSITSPSENNISQIGYSRNALDISTAIIGKLGTGYVEKQSTGSTFPRSESFVSYNEGDDDLTVENDLAVKEVSQNEISLTPITTDFSLNVGDIVKVRIERGNVYTDFTAGLKILQKTLRIDKGSQIIDIVLSQIGRKVNSAENFFVDMNARIKKLETI